MSISLLEIPPKLDGDVFNKRGTVTRHLGQQTQLQRPRLNTSRRMGYKKTRATRLRRSCQRNQSSETSGRGEHLRAWTPCANNTYGVLKAAG